MTAKNYDKQAWSIFRRRFPGQHPKKGQIKEIKRELLKKNKNRTNTIPVKTMSVREIAKTHINSDEVSYTVGDPFSYGKKKYSTSTEREEAHKAMSKYYRQYGVGPVVGAGGSRGSNKLPNNYKIVNAPPQKQVFIGGVGFVPASKTHEYDSSKQARLNRRASKLFNERFPGQQPKKGQIKEIMKELLDSKDNT